LALWGGACGGPPATVVPDGDLAAITDGGVLSCTIVEFFSAGQTATLCLEVPMNGGQTLQQSCSRNAMGTPVDAGTVAFTDGPCSRADALGACRVSVGGLIEDQWYYGSGGDSGTSVFDQTASNIKMLCSGTGATYLAP
jgi:hypothetical protein